MQLWDLGTGRVLADVPFGALEGEKNCQVYGARFAKKGRMIVAAGSGSSARATRATTGDVRGARRGVTRSRARGRTRAGRDESGGDVRGRGEGVRDEGVVDPAAKANIYGDDAYRR